MLRRLIILGVIFAACAAQAVDEVVVTAHGPRKSPTILRVNPVIPKPADETAKEGWVHLRLALSADGDVKDAKIVEAYPQGWFEDAVMNVVYGWKFHPRLENGVAVADPAFDIGVTFYADEYETGRNTAEPWERGGRVRGISPANMATFRKLAHALDSGDLKTATQTVDVLRRRFNANDLSVVEVARYYAFLARYDRMSGHFIAAMTNARQAFLLAQFLDNGKVVDGLHMEMIAALTGMGRNDQAVDYYTSWSQLSKTPLPEPLITFMEALRAEGAGKGTLYTIVDFDDTHVRRERRASAGSGANAQGGSMGNAGGGDSGGSGGGSTASGGAGSGSGPQETRNHLQVQVQSLCLELPNETVGHCS